MKSNKKSFGRFWGYFGIRGTHFLCWTKKKVGKRWKIMYVERTHEKVMSDEEFEQAAKDDRLGKWIDSLARKVK